MSWGSQQKRLPGAAGGAKGVKREEPMSNQPPDWLHFWRRPFPSANTLLIEDEKPVLIDSGFGRDVPFFDATHLPLPHHVHDLISLQGSPHALRFHPGMGLIDVP